MTLIYIDDGAPGYTREQDRHGRFRYRDRRGRLIRHPGVLARIRALAIPPAYRDVWICARADGHLQATGRDAQGRKQYRYHDDWTAHQGARKFDQLAAFGAALPRIRRLARCDLREQEPGKTRVLALVVLLMDATLIRVGNPRYARRNQSYGLTTLEKRHVHITGTRIRFRFRGKSGVRQDVSLDDRMLARSLKRCLETPGTRLFRYRDEQGRVHDIASADVNSYLQGLAAHHVTAKDYRTWGASVLAFESLRGPQRDRTTSLRKRRQNATLKAVAARLGNTPAVCRQCYVHPRILRAHMSGPWHPASPAPRSPRGLTAAERRFLHFLAHPSS